MGRTVRRTAPGVAALGVVLAVGGCGTDTVLIDEGALGAVATRQNLRGWNVPGWTWCSGLAPDAYAEPDSISTALGFGSHGSAGAVVMDRAGDGITAEYLLDRMGQRAVRCDRTSLRGAEDTIVELDGLAEGDLGWRTTTAGGEWGEYVLTPLDDMRVLAVGFTTSDTEAPVDLDELVALARAGVERMDSEG